MPVSCIVNASVIGGISRDIRHAQWCRTRHRQQLEFTHGASTTNDETMINLGIFAKAPISGHVKTRLAPAIGLDAAARLHARMIERTLTLAHEAGLEAVTLWTWPQVTDPHIIEQCRQHGFALTVQQGQNLGQRMAYACEQASPQLIIGTDCPGITAQHLRRAADDLKAGAQLVLTPALDGGYVLIGLRQPRPEIFQNITWGSAEVLAQTRTTIRKLDLQAIEYEPLWDVDRPEDLIKLREAFPVLAAKLLAEITVDNAFT
ncbi:glycosyltransferase [Allopusillimonas ginsengisoli]|nr:glycosyltransferase [Allopusillimonas ginsengisoli]